MADVPVEITLKIPAGKKEPKQFLAEVIYIKTEKAMQNNGFPPANPERICWDDCEPTGQAILLEVAEELINQFGTH